MPGVAGDLAGPSDGPRLPKGAPDPPEGLDGAGPPDDERPDKSPYGAATATSQADPDDGRVVQDTRRDIISLTM